MLKALLGKKTFKLVSYSCLLLLTLVGTVSATVSWFASTRTSKLQAEQIAVIKKEEAQDFNISYRVLKFDDSQKKGVENKVANKFTFKLDSFDYFISSRNANLSQLVEFTITSSEDHPHGGYVILDFDSNQRFLATGTEDKVSPYISNLVKFDACLYSYTLNDDSTEQTFFTMGNINRYKKAQTGEEIPYSNAEPDDKIYQEVEYHLDSLENPKKYTYIKETDISGLPDPSTDPSGYLAALQDIDENKPGSISLQIDKGMGYRYQIPLNYKEAKFYLRFDYSNVLAMFFAKNQNSTIYEPTAGGSAVTVANDIPTIRVRIQSNEL